MPGLLRDEPGGASATLRARGRARFFDAAFLGVWLLGWLAGELFAIAAALAMAANAVAPGLVARWLSGGPPGGVASAGLAAFLFFWLAIWTAGGVAAAWQFLLLVAGQQRVAVRGGELLLQTRAGPFRRRRSVPI